MGAEKNLREGRAAFSHGRWTEAYARLSELCSIGGGSPEDLESLAVAAYLTGRSTESNDAWSQAHQAFLKNGNVTRAARCAFWFGFMLLNTGESARGGGWIARAGRLLEEANVACVEAGYILLPRALKCLSEGNGQEAFATFEEAAKIAQRFGDRDLMVLSLLGKGLSTIALGETQKGLSLLDEVMADVESKEVSPIVSGIVYCAVIEACVDVYDARRAQEWTAALSEWCASQPDLVPFRGPCLIRRSEILQLHGSWSDALDEVIKATTLLKTAVDPAAGAAYYQLAELHRLRGHYAEAEKFYYQANSFGRNPQPGLALLKLAKGDLVSAKTAISHALAEAKRLKSKTRILPTYVDIMLEAKQIPDAHRAAAELSRISAALNAPLLNALAAQATASVLLAQGKADVALNGLSQALAIWTSLEAPYECARVRFKMGQVATELGDGVTARMQYEASRAAFLQLEAMPDLARVDALLENRPHRAHGLTSRELEVLRLLATGKTNKAIAAEIFISERTVDRHVSNILAKLEVPSRSAATAFAYERHLV